MNVLLVGNYRPDAQQSMLRFGAMLEQGLAARGFAVATIAPRKRWLALASRAGRGAAKWLGYLDKYAVFPRELRRRVAELAAAGPLVVHIVDHSNAVYVPRRAGGVPWVVTCHDLLAVRGALGEDTDCPASTLGRRLQHRILAGLARADAVACDSTSTRQDLERLAPSATQSRRVILLGLNQPFQPVAEAEARARLAGVAGVPWDRPFLLHVGSNLKRKNRAAIVRVLGRLRDRWPGQAVFCGEGLDADLVAAAQAAGVKTRVFGAPGLSAAQLEAAYALAHALVFPSKCEGFGWPVVEAQACGCPVICSDRTSLPEVAGPGARVLGFDDEAGMAAAVLELAEAGPRARAIALGGGNVDRFRPERMLDDYAAWYRAAAAARPGLTG